MKRSIGVTVYILICLAVIATWFFIVSYTQIGETMLGYWGALVIGAIIIILTGSILSRKVKQSMEESPSSEAGL